MGRDWLTGNPILTRHHERHSKKGLLGWKSPQVKSEASLPPGTKTVSVPVSWDPIFSVPQSMSSVPQSILCRKLGAALRPLLDCIGGVGLGVARLALAQEVWVAPGSSVPQSVYTVWRSWRCASLVNCGDNGYLNTNLIVTVDTCWNPCLSVCLPNVPA